MQLGFEFDRLKQEACSRWLKPSEILFILQNHEGCISDEVPDKPPSGSLWLFNKRVLRFFRRDGYTWKKKKDGRAGEGHERLKVDGIDALNCYYAHGEQNKYFQRRSYWMLNPVYEHIVLVHYREVSEGKSVYVSTNSPSCSSINGSINGSDTQDTGLFAGISDAFLPCNQIECSGGNVEISSSYQSENRYRAVSESPETNFGAEIRKLKLQLSLEDQDEAMQFANQEIEGPGLEKRGTILEQALSDAAKFLLHSDEHVELLTPREIVQSTEENSNFLFVHNQESYQMGKTKTIASEADSFEFSEFWSDQVQCLSLTCPVLKPTLSNNLQFHIREVSPEWAFSFESTKVIITGDFLCDLSDRSWAVMFGDTEVPLKIIQDGVLRCETPKHAPGKVRLCITSGNGEPCSELKDFEYLPMMPESNSSVSGPMAPEKNETRTREELLLLVNFAKQLLCVSGCASSLQNEDASQIETDLPGKVYFENDQWDQIIEMIIFGDESQNLKDVVDWLVQQLLKDKLHLWLSSRNKQKLENTSSSLSKQEKCMIHMISGLGYDWALHPLVDSGVGVNFRDVNGWTSLHWAARFGRERMIAALLAAGASPGAVTDPNSHDPHGKTPASIAESNGYKGLAGYLSEVALTTHLSSLGAGDSENYMHSADLEAENTLEISASNDQRYSSTAEEQFSLKDSLAAVRNATQAASRIQAAFRAHSFRKKQQNEAADYNLYYLTSKDICSLSSTSGYPRCSKSHDRNSYGAAMCIQKRFRGWKGRRAFLSLRQNVVKIQAYVRGHQVRKKYSEILWTVGVLEKAVLRWRRKGAGLRGFHLEFERMDDGDEDDILKAFRKIKVDESLKQSVSRVLSMSKSPKAQQQYRRVLGSYHQFKAKVHVPAGSSSISSENTEFAINDDYLRIYEDLLGFE